MKLKLQCVVSGGGGGEDVDDDDDEDDEDPLRELARWRWMASRSLTQKVIHIKYETKEAQAKSPWGIIKVPWEIKLYYP